MGSRADKSAPLGGLPPAAAGAAQRGTRGARGGKQGEEAGVCNASQAPQEGWKLAWHCTWPITSPCRTTNTASCRRHMPPPPTACACAPGSSVHPPLHRCSTSSTGVALMERCEAELGRATGGTAMLHLRQDALVAMYWAGVASRPMPEGRVRPEELRSVSHLFALFPAPADPYTATLPTQGNLAPCNKAGQSGLEGCRLLIPPVTCDGWAGVRTVPARGALLCSHSGLEGRRLLVQLVVCDGLVRNAALCQPRRRHRRIIIQPCGGSHKHGR